MSLTITLIVAAATFAIFGFAHWRVRQPPEPWKARMINYHVVQLGCIVVLLLVISHILTLIFGHPVTGQQMGGQQMGGKPF